MNNKKEDLLEVADMYAAGHNPSDMYYTKDGVPTGIGVELSDAVVFGARWMEKKILDRSMDEGTLVDWYISSIDETIPPIWTPEHISELLKDFYVIPKK